MAETQIDLSSWPRAETFRWFRAYERPRYAITARIDLSRLMDELKPQGVSPYRACIYAIGAGVDAVPELRMRFRGDRLFLHDAVELSMTVPRDDGTFAYAYVPFVADWSRFDTLCVDKMDEAVRQGGLGGNAGERDDLAYLSCLPWIDFTALDNALPGPDDCIPRFSWGRIVRTSDDTHSVAMAVQVHHALVDGLHLGQFFAAAQDALDRIEAG